MREPDFDLDGWCLEDGEALHREAPDTFWLPALERREALQPGDLVKLIFRISVDGDEEPVAVERMWVLVRGRVGEHYFGRAQPIRWSRVIASVFVGQFSSLPSMTWPKGPITWRTTSGWLSGQSSAC